MEPGSEAAGAAPETADQLMEISAHLTEAVGRLVEAAQILRRAQKSLLSIRQDQDGGGAGRGQ